MLTKIKLENFKGYKTPTTIPLAPITFLFGPNSAGKSSVFHALLYLYEILQNDWCDVDACSLAPVNLGGFFNILSRHATEQVIRLSAEFAPSDASSLASRRHYLFDADEFETQCDQLGLGLVSPVGEQGANLTEVAIEIRWSSHARKPYVSSLNLFFDQGIEDRSPFLSILTDETLQETVITNVDFNGRFAFTDRTSFETSLQGRLLTILQNTDAAQKNTPIRIPIETSPAGAKPVLGQILRTSFTRNKKEAVAKEINAIYRTQSAQHPPDPDLSISLENRWDASRALQQLEGILTSFFTQAVVEYLEDLTATLASMAAIGPMRTVPARNFFPSRRIHPKSWYDGSAGWDAIFLASEDEFAQISRWMFRLKLGYTLRRNPSTPLSSPSPTFLPSGVLDTIALSDLEGNLFSPCDLGIGISQVVPVIAATSTTKVGIVYIEQPELHLHPALQAQLGDLFCAHVEPTSVFVHERDSDLFYPIRNNNRLFLLETHSEHLLLRILRRIRETDDGELSDLELRLSPNDIAVIYIDNQKGSATAKHLRVDQQGEFIDKWPHGFFTERADELF